MKVLKYVMVTLIATLSLQVYAEKAPYSDKEVSDAIAKKDWELAEAMLRTNIDDDPKSAKSWWLMAQCEEQNGRVETARDDALKAIEIDPSKRFAPPGAVSAFIRRLGLVENLEKSSTATSSSVSIESSKRINPALEREVKKRTTDFQFSFTWLRWLPGIFVIIGFVMISYHIYVKQKENKLQLDYNDREKKTQYMRLKMLQKRLSDLRKVILFESQEMSEIAKLVSDDIASVRMLLTTFETTKMDEHQLTIWKNNIITLERHLTRFENRAGAKQWGNTVLTENPFTKNDFYETTNPNKWDS